MEFDFEGLRSFWISTLDCWKFFHWSFLLKGILLFFSLLIVFGIFNQGSVFFGFLLLPWLILVVLFPFFFSSWAGKLGIMGPGFI